MEEDRLAREIPARLCELLDAGSRGEADATRAAVLALLGPTLGASGAALVPIDQKTARPERAVGWGDAIDLEALAGLLSQAVTASEPVSDRISVGPRRTKALMVRLETAGQPLAVLVFSGRRLRLQPEVATALRTAVSLISHWELNRRLHRLLSVAERRLRVLTADSKAVAERNRALSGQMVAHQRRLDGVSKGFIRMQEEERSRISRELHDGLGQSLTAVKINLDLLASALDSGARESAPPLLEAARKLAAETLEDVREMSRLLRPRMLDELGLEPTLRWLARSFSQRNRMAVDVVCEGEADRADADQRTLLFRVVQEGLNNAWKHARAGKVVVRLDFEIDPISLTIADDGTGVLKDGDDPAAAGSGLPGIRERVALAGGDFEISGEPGRGTTLRVRIPLGRPGGD